MSTKHFVVAQRDTAWQFSYRGDITGPFVSKQEAIDEAIAAASRTEDPEVEVVVRDADMKTETVWRPS